MLSSRWTQMDATLSRGGTTASTRMCPLASYRRSTGSDLEACPRRAWAVGFRRLDSTLAWLSGVLRAGCSEPGNPARTLIEEASAAGHRSCSGAIAGLQATQAGEMMLLSRSLEDTIREDLQQNPGFRRAYLREAVNCLLAGAVGTGKVVLRRYINLSVGFVQFGKDLGIIRRL